VCGGFPPTTNTNQIFETGLRFCCSVTNKISFLSFASKDIKHKTLKHS
jgi:hypothetical protein